MAGKSAVISVIVTGDAAPAVKAFDKAGDSAKDFQKQADKTSQGFDGLRDSADNSERRVMGFRDSLTGTGDVMKGLRDGDMLTFATGIGDLASAVSNLGADMLEYGKKAIEAGKSVAAGSLSSVVAKGKEIAATVAHTVVTAAQTVATAAQTAAQWALNAALSANPIALVVLALLALAAIFVILWKNSETFRDIVTGAFDLVKGAAMAAFNWVKDNWPLILAILTGPIGLAVLAISKNWDSIKAGFGAVKDFVVGAISTAAGAITGFAGDIVDAITGLPGKLTRAGAGMFDFIKTAFKSALNFVIDGWNGLEFKIPGFDPPGPGPKFSGFTLGVPDIPRLAAGGVVMPSRGGSIVNVAEGGEPELVLPLSRARSAGFGGGGGTVINITGNIYGLDDLDRKLEDAAARIRRRGGSL